MHSLISAARGPILAGGSFSSEPVGSLTNLRGLSFSRSSTATTHDLQAKTLTKGISVDTARIARDSAGRAGLLLEPTRTNWVLFSENLGGSGWGAGTAVDTANATAAPDGTLTAYQTSGSAGQYGKFFTKPSTHAVGVYYACSFYEKNNAGGAPNFMTAVYAVTAAAISPLNSSWGRAERVMADTSGGAGNNYAFVDGRDWTSGGGVAAVAFNLFRTYHQVETTPDSKSVRAVTSYIPTSGAATTRAGDVLSVASSTVVTNESVRLYSKAVMLNARSTFGEGTSTTATLWRAGSYYVQMSTATGVFTVSARNVADSAFVTDSTTTGITFSSGALLELWVVVGGSSATTIKYRIDGGPIVSLTMTGATAMRVLRSGAVPIGSSVDLFQNAGTDPFWGIYQDISPYVSGASPVGF